MKERMKATHQIIQLLRLKDLDPTLVTQARRVTQSFKGIGDWRKADGRIGKHYVDQIQWGLRLVEEKKILRIDRKASPSPVFLKVTTREDFYVRNGPSSVLLSGSETVGYSKKHFR